MKKANLMIAGSLGFLVLGLGLVGCSSSKDASKENFAKIISQKIDKQPDHAPGGQEVCLLRMEKIGVETSVDKNQEALVKLGLLTSRTVQAGVPGDYRTFRPEQKIYELTDKGKQIAESRMNFVNKKVYILRYCRVAFKEVLSHTEDSNSRGIKYSKVKYAFTFVDVPDWAKDEALLNLQNNDFMKKIVKWAGKPIEYEQSLVLMDDGWAIPG